MKFTRPEIKRGTRGNIEQQDILLRAFHAAVNIGQRVLEVMRDVLIEFDILLLADLALGTRPQRRGAIDDLILVLALFLDFHDYRKHDVVRVLVDDRTQAVTTEEFIFALAQVQYDFCATCGLIDGFQGIFALTIGLPAHALICTQPGTPRRQGNVVGDDEGRVEADAKLPDKAGVFLLVAGQRLEKPARAGAGNGTDIFYHFITVHADAIVGDGNGACLLIVGNTNFEIIIVLIQIRIG